MGRKLPPFAALRAFEAVARRGSLQEAAEELLISASAVSHQVKALETFLGVKLLLRQPGGLRPTEAGAAYLECVGGALDRLAAGTLRLLGERGSGRLTVHVLQSLAQLWLIPQLGDFVSDNPDVALGFVTRPEAPDFSGSDLDCAIVYGREAPREAIADKLLDEVMTPVCAPSYLRAEGPIAGPGDLPGHRLIGCDHGPDEWPAFLAALSVETPKPEPQLVFDSRAQALNAAAEGLGVALDRSPAGALLRRRGALVAPLDLALPTGAAYWLVAPERSALSPAVKQFRAWLASLQAA